MRILNDTEYQRMQKNGWRMVRIEGVAGTKQDQQIEYLTKTYNTIKKYLTTSYVRGYYNTVYACKNK